MTRIRGGLVIAVVLVAVVLTVVAAGADRDRPFDPTSAAPLGYLGLHDVLVGVGGEVEVIDAAEVAGSSATRFDAVLVPDGGGAAAEQRDDLTAYARAGGRLVLAGPIPGVGTERAGEDMGWSTDAVCDVDGLEDVDVLGDDPYQPLHVPAGATSCFGDGRSAAVVAQEVGAGLVVTLASPRLLANDAMRARDQEIDDPKGPMPDNVVMAVRLLIPNGGGRVGIVDSGLAAATAGGDATISELLPSGVRLGLWQLVVAFGCYAWWRARRHGSVVVEHQPVPIEGSELVGATGNFLRRGGDAAAAAAVLRAEVAADLRRRLGLPPDAPLDRLAAAVAAHSVHDADAVLAALWRTPVADDERLVAVARELESIRQEVSRV